MASHSYNTRAASAKRLKVCKERELLEKNRICNLPDELLVSILSLLTMKEAGKTSVLSKRWRHLWAYIPTLNFDSSKLRYDLLIQKKSKEEEVPKYLRWVDQVVSLHKAPALDEFRVRFVINGNARNSIDSWVRFAVEKRVKRLAIDLSTRHAGTRRSFCTFPSLLSCSNSLTSLEFACVNISDEVIESLLSSCLALEHLSVSHSDSIVSLKVSGPSLGLKCLRIHDCLMIKELEISAPNLVSLYYAGRKIHLHYKSTPKIVEISFSNGYPDCSFLSAFSNLGCYLSQIEVLNLQISYDVELIRPLQCPVFERLTKLEVKSEPLLDRTLSFILSLITASPLLHHFKLQEYQLGNRIKWRQWFKSPEVRPHYNLKIVEIVGFTGFKVDLELASYLIETAPSLDKFIVDTRSVLYIGTPYEFKVTPQIRKARKRVEKVRPLLKAGTDLVIRGPWAPADFQAN